MLPASVDAVEPLARIERDLDDGSALERRLGSADLPVQVVALRRDLRDPTALRNPIAGLDLDAIDVREEVPAVEQPTRVQRAYEHGVRPVAAPAARLRVARTVAAVARLDDTHDLAGLGRDHAIVRHAEVDASVQARAVRALGEPGASSARRPATRRLDRDATIARPTHGQRGEKTRGHRGALRSCRERDAMRERGVLERGPELGPEVAIVAEARQLAPVGEQRALQVAHGTDGADVAIAETDRHGSLDGLPAAMSPARANAASVGEMGERIASTRLRLAKASLSPFVAAMMSSTIFAMSPTPAVAMSEPA